jgi:ABC-type antimicrobial peptide transport system ATPase subunit
MFRQVHVVVDEEHDVRPHAAAPDEVGPLLDHGLAGRVRRVGLARQYQLRPTVGAAQNALQALGVV